MTNRKRQADQPVLASGPRKPITDVRLPEGYTEPNFWTRLLINEMKRDVWPEGIHDLVDSHYTMHRDRLGMILGAIELAYLRGYAEGKADAEGRKKRSRESGE